MKKVSILLLTLVYASVVFGQQKVAVWVEGKNTEINTVLADQLVSVITSSGKHVAIERSSDFLRGLKNEMDYAQSGNVADSQIAAIGKQLGANLICVAKVSLVANTNYVSARLINVETAQVIATANIHDDFKTIDAIIKSCEKLAMTMLGIETSEQKLSKIQQEQEKQREKARGFTTIGGSLYVQMSDAAEDVNYKVAVKICKNSSIGGFSTWRLPTTDELAILNTEYKKLDLSGEYWSSSDTSGSEKITYVFGTSYYSGHKSADEYDHRKVRCVRK
jgi:hypothetical protein